MPRQRTAEEQKKYMREYRARQKKNKELAAEQHEIAEGLRKERQFQNSPGGDGAFVAKEEVAEQVRIAAQTGDLLDFVPKVVKSKAWPKILPKNIDRLDLGESHYDCGCRPGDPCIGHGIQKMSQKQIDEILGRLSSKRAPGQG